MTLVAPGRPTIAMEAVLIVEKGMGKDVHRGEEHQSQQSAPTVR
jgi:hypothetical protein